VRRLDAALACRGATVLPLAVPPQSVAVHLKVGSFLLTVECSPPPFPPFRRRQLPIAHSQLPAFSLASRLSIIDNHTVEKTSTGFRDEKRSQNPARH
jgi:hypothetical protein